MDASFPSEVPPYRIQLSHSARHALQHLDDDAAWGDIRRHLARLAEGTARALALISSGPGPRVGAFQSGHFLIAYEVDTLTRTINVNSVTSLPELPLRAA